jgi:hypothetical protein
MRSRAIPVHAIKCTTTWGFLSNSLKFIAYFQLPPIPTKQVCSGMGVTHSNYNILNRAIQRPNPYAQLINRNRVLRL